MLQFDLTLVLVFISFLVFMGAMKSVYFDPVARMKILREQKIKLDQISLEELQQELDDLTQRLNYQMSESRVKAQHILLETQAIAKMSATAIVVTTREKIEQDRAMRLKQLQQAVEATFLTLLQHKPEFVTQLIEVLHRNNHRWQESGVIS